MSAPSATLAGGGRDPRPASATAREAGVAAEPRAAADDGGWAEALADLVDGRVEGGRRTNARAAAQLDARPAVAQVRDRDPDQRQPRRSISGVAGGQQLAAAARIGGRGRRSACGERVRAVARGSRRSAGAGSPCAPRSAFAHAARHAVDHADQDASSASGERARRPSADCEPIERGRRPAADAPRVAVVGEGVEWRPLARPSSATSVGLAQRRELADGAQPAAWSFAPTAGRCPRAARPAAGAGSRLLLRRHHQQAVGLRRAARHLGQELRPRDADGDRQADPLAHLVAQPRGRSRTANP